jgi:hypothetical protein
LFIFLYGQTVFTFWMTSYDYFRTDIATLLRTRISCVENVHFGLTLLLQLDASVTVVGSEGREDDVLWYGS